MSKKCCKCKLVFPIGLFNKDKTRKDGLNPRCRPCYKLEKDAYHQRHGHRLRKERKEKYWLDPEISRKISRERRNPLKENKRLKKERAEDPLRFKGYHLKRSFGITLEDFQKMGTKQNWVCKICKKPETVFDKRINTTRNLTVDHDHKTGKIRGLLCTNCNKGLGMFKDDKNLLKNAIEYLGE